MSSLAKIFFFDNNINMSLQKSLKITALALMLISNLIPSVVSRAFSYQVPYDACELSKSYPTLTFKIDDNKALTYGLLLVNCKVAFEFEAITANPDNYTPIGQYTIDWEFTRKIAYLSNPAQGYKNLKTPNWMPYYKDESTGDFGEDIWRNNFGVHGAPWRTYSEFTGQRKLTLNGTHGCTNLPAYAAEYLYMTVNYYKDLGQKMKVYNYR
jgi:L,D-transpeptidase catalytic domain